MLVTTAYGRYEIDLEEKWIRFLGTELPEGHLYLRSDAGFIDSTGKPACFDPDEEGRCVFRAWSRPRVGKPLHGVWPNGVVFTGSKVLSIES